MAKTGTRMRVTKARQVSPGARWDLTLACGHQISISSVHRPQAATCRDCVPMDNVSA